jgi:hypothetical protein
MPKRRRINSRRTVLLWVARDETDSPPDGEGTPERSEGGEVK